MHDSYYHNPMNEKLLNSIIGIFEELKLGPLTAETLSRILIGVGVVLLSFLLWLISVKIVLRFVEIIVKRTKVTWDDDLVNQGVFRRIARTVPAITIWVMAPWFLTGLPKLLNLTRIFAVLGIISAVTLTSLSFLRFINAVYERREDSARRPIKGLIQAFQVLFIAAALMLAFSIITAKPVSGLFAGLGAVSAVIMLIFKDPLMGLVSGFQISSNDMVRIGDWIEVPSQGADGDVVDISLLNVTVQNWDRTWVTFPIQSLTTGGFKNWRGMSESGGRRIKRSLSIDLSSIRFLNEDEIEELNSVSLLKGYLENRTREIQEDNKKTGADRGASPLNGRALTNIGVLRTYAKAYVSSHPKVNAGMTLMVRQLQSGPEGLPLELYLFSADKVWANYEDIQSDIFDHLFAALPEFGLRAFQNPAGSDLQGISSALIDKEKK
ncbi:MAG: mechanosensitive ion channel family protein [Spirochaetes bacterium]|nr:MAG: mechanosensitive ion channel family protein [Spirochaetota bacterium]